MEKDIEQKQWEKRIYNLYIQIAKYIFCTILGLSLFIIGLSLVRGF